MKLCLQQVDIESIPFPMYLKNSRGIYCDCNPAFLELLELESFEDIVGKSDAELSWKDQYDEIQKREQLIFESNSEQEFELQIMSENGLPITLLIHEKLIYVSSKNASFLFGTCANITRYKTFKNKQVDSEHYFENILLNLPGQIYWEDKDGVFLGCNNQVALSAGYKSPKDIIGKTDYQMPWKNQADALKKTNLRIMESGIAEVLEEVGTLNDGRTLTYLTNKAPLRNFDNEIIGIIGISMNITDRKILERTQEDNILKSEKKAETSAANLEQVIACMPGSVYWKDKKGVYLTCNEAIAKVLGFQSSKDIVGKTNADLKEILSWDQEVLDSFNKVEEEVIRTGVAKINHEELPFLDGKGNKVYQLSSKVPLFNENGQVDSIVGISIDITALKEAQAREKAALADAIAARKEVEAMQEQVQLFKHISGTVAHELLTPLRAISFGVTAIEKQFPKFVEAYHVGKQANITLDEISERNLEIVKQAFAHITKELNYSFLFIDMLLSNIRAEKFIGEPAAECDIADIVNDAIERYPFSDVQRKLIHADLTNRFRFMGSEKLFVHILFNLIKNALYYVAKARKGVITIWCEKKNAFNELHFKDTGEGIAPDVLPKIFDQFFSQTEHGAGIGLTYCKMVMTSFGGDIICESTEGEYTEFILSFPKIS
ncbi:MAG: PAS domain-containing sensor histidine kinase [Proteobacteria bacterium]|nr:PAS domain-containing sensor histidine kinase [Pseudomonadota bacterium]